MATKFKSETLRSICGGEKQPESRTKADGSNQVEKNENLCKYYTPGMGRVANRQIKITFCLVRKGINENTVVKQSSYPMSEGIITYAFIEKECEEFIQQGNFRGEFVISYIHNESEKKLEPAAWFSFEEIQREHAGNLVIVLKSYNDIALEALKADLARLQNEYVALRSEVEYLKLVKQQYQPRHKNQSMIQPTLHHGFSMLEPQPVEKQSLDIAFLYSEPLSKENSEVEVLSPVDFRNEIEVLIRQLKSTRHRPVINLRCQIATLESLRDIIRYCKPKILHIMCHGTKEGSLEFQDDSKSRLGLLRLVDSAAIDSIFKDLKENLPQLVFVNSCHSSKVGQIFFKNGINNVVMINSQDTITDEAAKIFSQTFYRNIFSGVAVNKAFSTAKNDVAKFNKAFCCCVHSANEPHRQNCRFLAILKQRKLYNFQAHPQFHVPNKQCSCTEAVSKNQHRRNCKWARKILFEINEDFRKLNPNTNNYEYKEPSYLGPTQNLTICCCPQRQQGQQEAQITKPHSQCHKFQIKSTNPSDCLFDSQNMNNVTEINNLTPAYLLEAHEKSKTSLKARQRQLYDFYSKIKLFKCIAIYGISGVGLTTFAVKASTYLTERRIFQFFFFVDLYDIQDRLYFRHKFNQITKLDYNGEQIKKTEMIRKQILIVFDNCDSFINKSNGAQFYDQIEKLLQKLKNCKIFLVFKIETKNNFDVKRIEKLDTFQLKPLTLKKAKQLFWDKIKDKADFSITSMQLHKVLEKATLICIPKIIESFAKSAPTPLTLKILQQQLDKIRIDDPDKLISDILNRLKENEKQSFDFLIFISQFTQGISFSDLDKLSYYSQKAASSTKKLLINLPIKQDWMTHYKKLFTVKDDSRQIPSPEPHPKIVDQGNQKKGQQMEAALEMQSKYDKLEQQTRGQSYFIQKRKKGHFQVKRFIRDFVWNRYQDDQVKYFKFIFVAYFSLILQMLFELMKSQHYVYEQLDTYSAISSSGVFAIDTSIKKHSEGLQRNQIIVMTESIRMSRDVIDDLFQVFINNDEWNKKIHSADPMKFITEHTQDLLKIYKNRSWNETYFYLRSLKKSEQKVFLFLFQNLMVYIPTALKIAKAGIDEELLKENIENSMSNLLKLKDQSKSDRYNALYMKLSYIYEGLNYNKQTLTLAYDFQRKQLQNKESYLDHLRQQEDLTLNMLNLYSSERDFGPDTIVKIEQYQQFVVKSGQNLIAAKQMLIIALLYEKVISEYYKSFDWIYKKEKQKKDKRNQIIQLCKDAAAIFKQKGCIKLELKAELTAIKIYITRNMDLDSNLPNVKAQVYERLEECRKTLNSCEQAYQKKEYRLAGFTEFYNTIKELKIKIKDRLWKASQKRIIFMKAFPIQSVEGQPVIKNLVRKKNHFRKQIEETLEQTVDGHKIDVSAKFQVLSQSKVLQEANAKCSIMFLTVDVKIISGIAHFVCQNKVMKEQLIEITQSFVDQLNFDNIKILVLSGANTDCAVQRIRKLSRNPPILIALSYDPLLSSQSYNSSHNLDPAMEISLVIYEMIKKQSFQIKNAQNEEEEQSRSSLRVIKEIIRKQTQMKNQELLYTKQFFKLIVRKDIEHNNEVKRIHQIAAASIRGSRIKASIHLSNQDIRMYCTQGMYRDLSPGYEQNHNIQRFYYTENVLLRRWNQMIQLFKYIKHEIFNHEVELQEQINNYYKETRNQYGLFINVYGDNESGKTSFVREVAKILVEREFYDFGVFTFDGKTIENEFQGDFEAYISKEASANRMPTLEDFDRLLCEKTILIVDDFHLIKPRVNARMKMFMDKIISRRVNLVLVSVNELKLELLSTMLKIKIEHLDSFELEVLAMNILNIDNVEQMQAYERLKKQSKDSKKPVSIADVKKCIQDCKKNNLPGELLKMIA